MQMIDTMRNLYQEDSRAGDCLLGPQRWCNRQWDRILFSALDAHLNQILDVAKRIIGLVLLILPTVISYAIGLVAITIKACSAYNAPLLPGHSPGIKHPSFLDIVDPLSRGSGENPNLNLALPDNGLSLSRDTSTDEDIVSEESSQLEDLDEVNPLPIVRTFSENSSNNLLNVDPSMILDNTSIFKY